VVLTDGQIRKDLFKLLIVAVGGLNKLKHTEEDYLNADPFFDESEVLYRKTKLVKTRKEHTCHVIQLLYKNPTTEPHIIPVGKMAVMETAQVEGEWGKTYMCIECLDKYLDEENE